MMSCEYNTDVNYASIFISDELLSDEC